MEKLFEPIVAINENAKPHTLPTWLKLNDLLLVDAGIKIKRYCSDRNVQSVVNFENFHLKESKNLKTINIKNL